VGYLDCKFDVNKSMVQSCWIFLLIFHLWSTAKWNGKPKILFIWFGSERLWKYWMGLL